MSPRRESPCFLLELMDYLFSDPQYGLGVTQMTRMERWERALKMNLDPPEEVRVILQLPESVGRRDIQNPPGVQW